MITKPARKVPRKYTNVNGEFPSIKNAGPVWYESLLERCYMLLLEFDDDVHRYVGQPIKIPYLNTDGAKPRMSRYTPDLLIYRHDGPRGGKRPPRLVEVKTQIDLDKYSEEFAEKFAAAQSLANERDWVFETVTDEQINGPRLDNAEFLYPYLPNPPDAEIEEQINFCLSRSDEGKTGHAILAQIDYDPVNYDQVIRSFWQMVSQKLIHVDWEQKIGLNSTYQA